jgi:NAD-dependent deacetylase
MSSFPPRRRHYQQRLIAIAATIPARPAAGLVYLARDVGAKLIEINPENTAVTQLADATLRSPAGQILPQLLSAP